MDVPYAKIDYNCNSVIKIRLTQFENIKVAITMALQIRDMFDWLRKTKLRSIY